MDHTIVTWDKLAQVCGQYLGKGQQVAIEGRIQTRSWDDDAGKRHCLHQPTGIVLEFVDDRARDQMHVAVNAPSPRASS